MASGDSTQFANIEKFLLDKEFCEVKPLGKGSFGEVLSAISPNKKHVAIKIIKNKDSWHVEEKVWPLLHHKNVLPLLNIINIECMNLKLFVMPRHPYVLDKVLDSQRFLADKNGLMKVKNWLTGSLDGLEYLHKSGFAHTDVKSDNVLIASDGRALLCDFSGLTQIGEPLQRLCAPLVYRPPDCYDPVRRKNIEGCACDVWLFGMLSLNVLTRNWPMHRMKPVTDVMSWKINVEPVVLEALTETTFCLLMKMAFPAVTFTDAELQLAHEFVCSIMKWHQNDRPSVNKIKSHPFLTNIIEINGKNTKKVSPKQQTNPFLEGWNSTKMKTEEKIEERVPITVCVQKKTISNNHGENIVMFEKNDLMPVVQRTKERMNRLTNPFIEHRIDIDKSENKQVVEKDYDSPVLEQSNEVPGYPATGKRFPGRIKDWFKKKWNRTFQKPNKYKKLKEESE